MNRFESRPITQEQKERINGIVHDAALLEKCIDTNCKPSREKALALTALEECVMWANKSISHEELKLQVTKFTIDKISFDDGKTWSDVHFTDESKYPAPEIHPTGGWGNPINISNSQEGLK